MEIWASCRSGLVSIVTLSFPSKDKPFIGRPTLHVMAYAMIDGTMGSPVFRSASRLSSPEVIYALT